LTEGLVILQDFRMSEEKQAEAVEIADKVEKKHTETVHPAESPQENDSGDSDQDKNRLFGVISPVVFLLFMIFAMVVVLAVINLKQANPSSSGNSNQSQAKDPLIVAHEAELRALRSEINRERISMGLSPLPEGFEPMDEIATRLKNDADTLVALAGKFQQMLAEKDAEISQRNGEILRLERLRKDVSLENARLQSELQRALVSGIDSDRLKSMVTRLEAQRDALSLELETARTKLAEMNGAITADQYADLERRLAEAQRSSDFFENRVKELEKVRLFARSENELLPAAVELFQRLRKLEGVTKSKLSEEYSKIGVELGANVLHKLDFKTGSSELSQNDKDIIARIAYNDVPDGDLAFIVGYASTTGNPASNQTLSSDRATAAAEYFDGLKRPGQKVQAVYLGQTDRFSKEIPEENQICEIWIIRRK